MASGARVRVKVRALAIRFRVRAPNFAHVLRVRVRFDVKSQVDSLNGVRVRVRVPNSTHAPPHTSQSLIHTRLSLSLSLSLTHTHTHTCTHTHTHTHTNSRGVKIEVDDGVRGVMVRVANRAHHTSSPIPP